MKQYDGGTYSFSRKDTMKSLMLNVALCYMVTGMALPNIFMRLGLDLYYLTHLGIHDLKLNTSSRIKSFLFFEIFKFLC